MTGPLISPDERFVSSSLDDGLLIARPSDDRLFLFNSTARFIWERLIEGASESEVPGLIAVHYGIDVAQAHLDFNDTLRRWRADGLVRPCGTRRRYEIAGLAFDIFTEDAAVANVLGPMLAHLESGALRSPALEVDLDRRGDAIVLRAGGVVIERHLDDDSFIPALLSELFRYVSEKIHWVMSLHAAAVAAAGACVLMPGASGVGKSSLTAAVLSLDEMQLVADDLALLAGPTLDVVPVPLPLVIKSGSWNAVAVDPSRSRCARYPSAI
ncbi:MAG: PqqD family peptide modification chaperone [Rhizobiales bacterium]|nr:PqqD family peptide modification chaperone [Hyphomicrobiales bacterium]